MAAHIWYPNNAFHNLAGNQFVDSSIVADHVVIGGRSKVEQEEELLARLPYAAEATVHHYSRQGESLCMADTRTEVLRNIMAWVHGKTETDGGSSQRIYWLSGMAGTGKSTIARTVARTCLDDGRLGASFFFSRGGGERETARTFVTTIAVQLARLPQLAGYGRALREAICDAVREQPDIAQHGLGDQWKLLVLRPCQQMHATMATAATAATHIAPPCLPPLLIVIDALDECHAADEIEFVLALLSHTSGLAAAQLRILLTSRPEIPIREGLLDMPKSARRHLVLHHIDASVVGHDIGIFFERRLASIIRHGPFLPDMPDDDVLQQLAQRSGDLFVWAATACRFIKDGGPNARQRLDMILRRTPLPSGANPELELDEIYAGILRNALPRNVTNDEQESFCEFLRNVLGTIAVLFLSLSVSSLALLLSLPIYAVLDCLRDLHSIIDVVDNQHEPIRLQHASVRDFLLNNRRCSDVCFRVDEVEAHTSVGRRCLYFMNDKLRKNICFLKGPGVLTRDIKQELAEKYIPPPLRYACLSWVQHILLSKNAQTLQNPVMSFMREHFLHWLEVLGVIGRTTAAVEIVMLLGNLYTESSRLSLLIADAKRFVLRNHHMIQEVPLQAYISALAFSPSNSVIRRAYTDELPQWLTRLLQTPKDWDQEWLSLEGHRDWVGVLAFLPDDLLLASGSRDNTVKLWDITTGAAGGTLEGHTDSVLALTFSPDGQLLASASSNESIRLWRAKSGAACGILEGHSDDIGALAFTPDSLLLASASDDTTIRLWSPAMVEARGTLIGHTDKVKCAIFMPDGSYLLSTGLDATVKVWNVETMSIIRTVKLSVAETVMARFNQHGEIVFSPNCQLLAVKSEDNLIGLWNITTGAAILVYAELDLYRFSLVFSPYSRFITSSTGQNSHEIWDVQTQKRDVVPNGVRAVSVAFSIDGQFLALGSDTGIISLLIFNSMPANEDYNDQPRYISTIAFSSDGSQLVSGSSSGEIGLLSLLSGKEERVWLENVYDEINVVALHPDCMQIAVVSGCTLWLSHIDQGEERLITSAVLDIAFSPAGKTIATAHSNQFWATKTGAEIRTLFGHSKSVTAVTFSSGDDILASGSADKTVRLWQTYSGAQCGILKGHLDPVWRVSFSPNSKLLGSSSDNEVLIWNPRTCELLYKIHTTIDSKWLKFSADSRIITTKNTAYWLPLLLSSAPAGSASTDSYALAIMDKWLTCNMENLLWIPPQYRSDIVAIHNLTIALCCS